MKGSGSKLEREIMELQSLFKDSGLQVIVKLANIHLTPDKPNYDGGSWHIEVCLSKPAKVLGSH